MRKHSVHILCLLEFSVFVYTFLDKNTFERRKMQLLQQFALANLELATQQLFCIIDRATQNLAYGNKHRCTIVNHAATGGYAYLAIGKGIQGIYCLVGRDAGSKMHKNLYLIRGIVVDTTYLHLAILHSL